MRKPVFCICENKDANQVRGNREADQCLCFRFLESKVPLLPKYEISILWLYSPVCVGPGRNPRRQVFSQRGSFDFLLICLVSQATRDFVYTPKTSICNFPGSHYVDTYEYTVI